MLGLNLQWLFVGRVKKWFCILELSRADKPLPLLFLKAQFFSYWRMSKQPFKILWVGFPTRVSLSCLASVKLATLLLVGLQLKQPQEIGLEKFQYFLRAIWKSNFCMWSIEQKNLMPLLFHFQLIGILTLQCWPRRLMAIYSAFTGRVREIKRAGMAAESPAPFQN